MRSQLGTRGTQHASVEIRSVTAASPTFNPECEQDTVHAPPRFAAKLTRKSGRVRKVKPPRRVGVSAPDAFDRPPGPRSGGIVPVEYDSRLSRDRSRCPASRHDRYVYRVITCLQGLKGSGGRPPKFLQILDSDLDLTGVLLRDRMRESCGSGEAVAGLLEGSRRATGGPGGSGPDAHGNELLLLDRR